jgi:hypothetical protein
LVLASPALHAAPPAWWTDSASRIFPPDPTPTPHNYAPANLGQLKKMATQAEKYLSPLLPENPQKTAVEAKLAEFAPDDGVAFTAAELAANYAPVNLGQLKATAKPFYDWINSVLGSALPYPWTASTADDANYAPANLGQLKNVFSFDLTSFDTDHDGITDAWEMTTFGDLSHDNATDSDGDGVSDLDEIDAGTPWNDFWNGAPPPIEPPDVLLSSLTDSDGDGLPDSYQANLNGSNASGDNDGDGLKNLTEYLAGTDPLVSNGVGANFTATGLKVYTPLNK